MKQIIITLLLALVSLTGQAQNANPMGLYKLSEIIHQDGKHVEASFKQYKYCQKEFSLMLNHDAILFPGDPFSFTISNPDGKPLLFTGELSKTENRGIQVFGTSDSTFTLRWFNDRGTINEHLFPYQTNIDETYELVKDSTDAILRALNLLQMKLGTRQHRLQGAWKLRGTQQTNTATSQYWIERSDAEVYQIFGSMEAVMVYANARFPKGNMQCHFMPCVYLSENAFECGEKTFIVHWFDSETISLTTLDETGQTNVTVWDRQGLPRNIQDTFGTDTPLMQKDVSRFFADEFQKRYGSLSDSVRLAYETFDFAVSANESSNAIFPVLMRQGFEEEYKAMKDSLLSRLMRSEIDVDEAVGRYVFWFYKDFDRHTSCTSQFFRRQRSEVLIHYNQLIPKYAPEPVGCKVDAETYLLRLPSCMGDVPTWDWMLKKEEEFKRSGCKYLILDLRGNPGGNDFFSNFWAQMMCNGCAANDQHYFYRNSTANNKMLRRFLKAMPDGFFGRVLAETDTTAEGSLINWMTIEKGTEEYTPLVRKGAIIIDNFSASAAESPIRLVRDYPRSDVKVYGRERTNGCEQTGNINTVHLPNSDMTLSFPMTVDDIFEEACKERSPGYKPDVIIPLPYPKCLTDNIDEWVRWVAKKMKKSRF